MKKKIIFNLVSDILMLFIGFCILTTIISMTALLVYEKPKPIVIEKYIEIQVEYHTWVEKIPVGMEKAMISASNEFDISLGLLKGIASAESGMGKYFYKEYDKDNCYNWWGIKPPGGQRTDGSYLRCYESNLAGARSAASLLKRLYIDQGLDTPEKICRKWIGSVWADQNCPHWVNNVKVYM